MSEQRSLHTARVLVVAKTQTGRDNTVNGIAWIDKQVRCVRLIAPRSQEPASPDHDYEMGDVWEIKTAPDPHTTPPHLENFVVYEKQKLYVHDNPVSVIERFMSPTHGGLDVLYEGRLHSNSFGALHIEEAHGIPSCSVMFWRPDRPLQRDTSGKRIRYLYPTQDGCRTLAFVGSQEPPDILPAGSLLCVSLTSWWRPQHAPQEPLRCFLQLSGWFLETPSQVATLPASPQPVDLSQLHSLLQTTFGHEEFRPLQQKMISNILARQDTLIIMPTGGGKSLCYQLPALCFQGLTVVVSPLISLMQDQVTQLQQMDVAAVFLNSTLNYREYNDTIHRIKRGEVKLLYVAPETLLRSETLDMLKHCQVDCLAIDEAHCISHWGHDFRPEYRQIATVRQQFPHVVCVALTATATPRVQEDIKQSLHFREHNTFVASFDRSNLFLELKPKLDLLTQILEFLAAHPNQSGIIYCSTQRQVNSLCTDLVRHNISALPYHAGLDDQTRRKHQTAFIRDDVAVMVATVAFGMGINKPDVRFVLHADLPKSLECYYQEIGRAGRDGLPADCLLLLSYGDVGTIQYFIQQGAPSEVEGHQQRLQALVDWTNTGECRRKPLLAYFGELYPSHHCGMCDNCRRKDMEQVDLTEMAHKFLTCVLQTGELFGTDYIIKVLVGSRAKDLLQRQHHQLTVYATGKEYTDKQWKLLAHQLIQQELLVRDQQYGGLKLTHQGRLILHQRKQILGLPIVASSHTQTDTLESYDVGLFQQLRTKRKQIADTEQVPPYVIFSDRALREMATYFPHSPMSLQQMHSIGQVKVEKYADLFLPIIQHYCQEHGFQEKSKKPVSTGTLKPAPSRVSAGSRAWETGQRFCAGDSIPTLMHAWDVKRQTILTHLATYIHEGHTLPVEQLRTESSLPVSTQNQILHLFENQGDVALRPIYDALEQTVPYDELHLMRMIYRLQQKQSSIVPL